MSPASALLADAVSLQGAPSVLMLGCGHGALGVALAQRAGSVVLRDSSAIAVAMAERTLRANAVANAQVRAAIDLAPDQVGTFDVAALEIPGDRDLTRRWLVEARQALKLGGALYLAGANDHGIRPAIADAAALFGGAEVLAYRQGNRVALARNLATAVAPSWASEGGIAPGTWREFAAAARGHSFQLRSLPGVFADGKLDQGTRLLIEAIEVVPGAGVLDIGCGYGMIGLVAGRLGARRVDMLDANLLAVACASENIALNAVAGARAFASDGVPAGVERRYDVVATNPPFHVGKATDYDVTRAFVEGARRALRPGGAIFLVANRFLRYDQLLRASFEQVRCVAETRSYRVWKASR